MYGGVGGWSQPAATSRRPAGSSCIIASSTSLRRSAPIARLPGTTAPNSGRDSPAAAGNGPRSRRNVAATEPPARHASTASRMSETSTTASPTPPPPSATSGSNTSVMPT